MDCQSIVTIPVDHLLQFMVAYRQRISHHCGFEGTITKAKNHNSPLRPRKRLRLYFLWLAARNSAIGGKNIMKPRRVCVVGTNEFRDMKAGRLIFMLLLASTVTVVQVDAQQTKADQKQIEEVKAKAEAGDAESQAELGLRYEQGKGVAKDQVEAVKWYRKAAEQNFAPAQNNLGVCYELGQGLAKDQERQ